MHRTLAVVTLILLARTLPGIADTAAKLPTWPTPKLAPGEREGKSSFGVVQHWLGIDGVAVTFHHVVRGDGKGVLRAFWPGGQQDVLVHDFGDDEMFVVNRDDGQLGFQFHRYVNNKPDLYLAVRGRWTGKGVLISKKLAFNGKQPTPAWLFDPIDGVAPPVVAWRTMARGARSQDTNAFTHYFDDAQITVKQGGADKTVSGRAYATDRAANGLPLLGFEAKCDQKRCCTANNVALAAWDHVTKLCFSEGAEPRVRSIEVGSP